MDLSQLAREKQYAQGIAQQDAAMTNQIGIRPPTIRENLISQRDQALRDIERIDRILRLLDSNPDTEQILQLLAQNGRF